MTKKINNFIPTIGIECHVQLKTVTKLFAAVGNDATNAKPNTLISHICLGMPGALPSLNKKAVEYGIRSAFAFNTKPQKYSYFERKHYFYPDLPKGYQITQLEKPIVVGGTVDIKIGGITKKIRINRVQLEEDAGKNTHPTGKDYSLVDLNRAGTPLLEIVSEPDIKSPAEAKAYARELYLLMKYSGVSDCDLYQGHMRFDVNVSLSQDTKIFGTRTETKNLNSFRSVEKAAEYEIKRQSEILQKGGGIAQETRGWDEVKQKTIPQRGKEEAHDYRYMPDPDIPPVYLSDEFIKEERSKMPNLPAYYRNKLKSIDIEADVIEDIIDSPEATKMIVRILEKSDPTHSRRIAFWMMQTAEKLSEDNHISESKITLSDEYFIKLSQLVTDGKLSSTSAKEVFAQMLKTSEEPEQIANRLNLIQVSDEGEIEKIVKSVINDNPKAAEDVVAGEMKAIGFLVGQVMKQSKGQANPGLAQKLIKKQLGV